MNTGASPLQPAMPSSIAPPAALPSFITSPTLTTPLPSQPQLVSPAPVLPPPVAPTVPASAPTNASNMQSSNGSAVSSHIAVYTPPSQPASVQSTPATMNAPMTTVVTPQTRSVSASASKGSGGQQSLPKSTHKDATAPVTSQPKPPGVGLTMDSSLASEEDGSAEAPGNGWVGWLKGTVSTVGHKVAQKAKTSMDTMITTLDPQMKEFLHSGGDLDLVVASDKEVKVSPVREAFQQVFGKATVSGQAPDSNPELAKQPVGLESCLSAAEQRINSVRSSNTLPHPSLPVLAIESCLVELTPGCWYDIGLLLLDDPYHDLILQTYTQATSVPVQWVEEARAGTPPDYPPSSAGLAVTVGQVAAAKLQVHHSMWHESWCGVGRREMLHLAARSLAAQYRARLPLQ